MIGRSDPRENGGICGNPGEQRREGVAKVYKELLVQVQLAADDLELDRRAQRQAVAASIAAALEQVHIAYIPRDCMHIKFSTRCTPVLICDGFAKSRCVLHTYPATGCIF